MQELSAAYKATTYKVQLADNKEFDLRVGEKIPKDIWTKLGLVANRSCACILADNPHSRKHSQTDNEKFRKKLKDKLTARGYVFFPALTVADQKGWPDEQGFFIFGITESGAMEIGRYLEQKAILFTPHENKALQLFWP